MAGSANNRGAPAFTRHFPPGGRRRVAREILRCITIGPPIAETPRALLSRVRDFAPADIAAMAVLHREDALAAADVWLRWWSSQAPSARRR